MANTKSLSKAQIEHLHHRLDTAIREAVAKFAAKQTKPAYLSRGEQVALIRAGKAKLRPDIDGNDYIRLHEAFVFPENEAAEKQIKANEAAVEKFRAPLEKEARALMDKAILGGSEEALASLEAFTKKLGL